MGINILRHFITALLFLSVAAALGGCGGGGADGDDAKGESADPTYAVSGTVTMGGYPLQGVVITIPGLGSRAATTDASGRFSIPGLYNGTYTLTPSKAGYSFNPKSVSKTIYGSSIANVDFTGSPEGDLLWIADSAGKLGTVDLQTGAVNVIGNMGVTMTDIAFDSRGDLYGVTFTSLYRIDKATAVATKVGDLGISSANSLAVDGAGTLYTATNMLYTVDASTGKASSVGNGGASYFSEGDLAFVDSHLYLTSGSSLVELDPAKGSGTVVGSIGFSGIMAMASDARGDLYGVSGTRVVSIDSGTGAGTALLDYAGHGLTTAWGAACSVGTLNGGALKFPVDGNGWSFTSGSSAHTASGGYLDADDRYAFDLNIAGNADSGVDVHPVCPGEVIISDACWGFVLIKHSRPLVLDDGTTLNTWYSGYMHMANPAGLGHVDGESSIGTVSGWGRGAGGVCSSTTYNDHLHFVIYSGTPESGGLVSLDIANRLRGLSENISIWIDWCGAKALAAQDEPWWGDEEYPCD